MRVLFSCTATEGHVAPLVPLARAFADLGHEVAFATAPQRGGGIFDVAYLTATTLQMRPTIETPPFPNPSNGGFCDETDPLWIWTVIVSSDGKTMTLNPAGHDRCGDRAAILQGTWTRFD